MQAFRSLRGGGSSLFWGTLAPEVCCYKINRAYGLIRLGGVGTVRSTNHPGGNRVHKNKTIKFDMAGEGPATKVLFFEASQTKRCELFAFPTAISVSSMYGPSHGRGTLDDSGPGLRRRLLV